MHVSRTSRRLSVFSVSPIHKQDTDYFRKLGALMDNGGREALMYYLLHRDIRKFNHHAHLHTRELDEQKEKSLNPVSDFWLECLDDNRLPSEKVRRISYVDGDYNGYIVPVDKLVWCFNEWAKRTRERPLNAREFAKQLRKIVPEMPPAENIKCQPLDINKRFNSFAFRELGECRTFFDAYMDWKRDYNDNTKWELLIVDKRLWFDGW